MTTEPVKQWLDAFEDALQNAVIHGTGFIKVTTNGPQGLELSVVKPEDYRYVMEDPPDRPRKSQALTTEEVEEAWQASAGAKDRLKAFYDGMDDRLWRKNKLRQYKEDT